MAMRLERVRYILNAVVGVVVLGASGAAAWYMVQYKPAAPVSVAPPGIPAVRTALVVPQIVQTPVVGHGTVRPKRQLNVIPQVTGELIAMHPDLAEGRVIHKGEVLFQVDPTVYQARVNQVLAEIRALEGQLVRFDRQLEDLQERIKTADLMLENEEKVYIASKKAEGVVPAATVLADHQRYLARKDVRDELVNNREMIPLLKKDLEAQLEGARARLTQAEHDLKNTEMKCPFDARVESVSAHLSQVVTAFFAIATLTDIEAFEISMGIDLRDVRWLADAAQAAALERTPVENLAEVSIRCNMLGRQWVWRGHVTRFERVDEATRLARIVVEIRHGDLQATAADGIHKAELSIGMFCQIELPVRPLQDALVVPRHAIHDNEWVYVFEPDEQDPEGYTGRLGIRRVPVLRTMGENVLVSHAAHDVEQTCELQPHERVVVSPLPRPVVGMSVRLREPLAVGRIREAVPFSAPVRPVLVAAARS